MRQTIIAGNWKMNASKGAVNTLITGILAGMADVSAKVLVCPPAPYLSIVEALAVHSQLGLGAQNLNSNASGAFTGEISADMLKDFGVQYVIVGHSERRSLYFESNDTIAKKAQTALKHGLTPIICIGETLSERQANTTEKVITQQLNALITHLGISAFNNIIIAYEPIWAIGTGVTASPEQAQQAHSFIRNLLATHDDNIAQNTPVLYGGSMNPKNASALLAEDDIDGGLIGGASLKAADFLQICKAG